MNFHVGSPPDLPISRHGLQRFVNFTFEAPGCTDMMVKVPRHWRWRPVSEKNSVDLTSELTRRVSVRTLAKRAQFWVSGCLCWELGLVLTVVHVEG